MPGPLNVHRMLTVGILLAAKLMDDRYFNNAYYAKVSLILPAAAHLGGLHVLSAFRMGCRLSGRPAHAFPCSLESADPVTSSSCRYVEHHSASVDRSNRGTCSLCSSELLEMLLTYAIHPPISAEL